ncbi:MAG: ATPase V [Spirochaetaceae bacterium]|nr:ATPase V [Spirochaetaceae bacterium]
MKYFVIGEREIVLAFRLVGVQGAIAVNRKEALDAFNRVVTLETEVVTPQENKRPTILIITEEIGVFLEEEIQQWQMKGDFPLIVEIPGLQGHIEGKKSLTESIREAIGIHV